MNLSRARRIIERQFFHAAASATPRAPSPSVRPAAVGFTSDQRRRRVSLPSVSIPVFLPLLLYLSLSLCLSLFSPFSLPLLEIPEPRARLRRTALL